MIEFEIGMNPEANNLETSQHNQTMKQNPRGEVQSAYV